MGRARLDGDVPLGCIRPSVRTLNSGSPSRVDISLRSRRSSLAGRTARILADVIPPKTVDRGPTTDVNRGAQDELDINCGWNGQRLRKSTACLSFEAPGSLTKKSPVSSVAIESAQPFIVGSFDASAGHHTNRNRATSLQWLRASRPARWTVEPRPYR